MRVYKCPICGGNCDNDADVRYCVKQHKKEASIKESPKEIIQIKYNIKGR